MSAAGGGVSTSAERVLASTSVTAIAAASAVPKQLADVISVPRCASTVSYVVGGRVEMGMP